MGTGNIIKKTGNKLLTLEADTLKMFFILPDLGRVF